MSGDIYTIRTWTYYTSTSLVKTNKHYQLNKQLLTEANHSQV